MSEQNENRNSRNRNGGNRNRNRSGGNGGQRNRSGNSRNRNGGGGERKPSQQRNELQPTRNRRSKPKPLTLWQKILKAIGLYKDPNEKPKGGNQRGPAQKTAAKKTGRVAGGGRVDPKEGGNKKGAPKPRRERKSTPPPTKVETPRLYVGNLSYETTEYDLEELFKGVGAVRKVELVYNRHTHKSKGYGFVNMANMDEAERAVEVLHDQPFMGRKLIVNGARSKGPNDGPNEPQESKSESPPEAEPAASEAPTEAPSDVPAEEEVHSLSPNQN